MAGLEHTVAALAARELDDQQPFILGRIQVQALVPHVRSYSVIVNTLYFV